MSASSIIPINRDLQAVNTLKNKEDIRLIWLDAKIDNSQDSVRTQTLLLEFNPAAQFYTDPNRCIVFIKSTPNEKILLIVSGALAREILSQIHDAQQITAVFVFCGNRKYHIELISKYSKVVDVFTKQDILLQSIRDTMQIVEKQLLAFSLFDQKQKSTKDLSKDSASFLWHQLLLHVLKKMPQDEQAKTDLVTICLDFYGTNKQESKKIEKFRKHYTCEQAIEWYTDECFLYKLLNRAIRTEDIELLYLFRFFIIDLCTALEGESKKLKSSGILTLYRGQQIPNDEFEKLRKSVGILISTNGFLSTSRNINVALTFARQFRTNCDMKTCIFEIQADPTLNSVIFADIDEYSKMKGEEEVLFGLNTTFRIDSIKMDKTLNMWKIKLSTTTEGNTRIEEYMKLQEEQMKDSSPMIYFGRLLLNELGKVEQAEKYFKKLLTTLSPTHSDISDVYNNIGNVYGQKGEQNLALQNYEESYRIRQKVLPKNHPKIGASLHNIGLIYDDKGEYDRALDLLQQTLAIEDKNYPGDHIDKAHTIVCIGLVYQSKEDLNTALTWLNRAFDMYTRVLPANHPHIAKCLGNLGDMYEKKGDLDRTIDFYRRRLEIEEDTLPSDHSNLSTHLKALVKIYKKKNGMEMALAFCEKQLVSQRAILGDTHHRIASTLMIIGDISQPTEQRQYYEQALSILKNCHPPNDLVTLDCLDMLGAISLDEGKFQEGLAHWQHILDIRRRIHSPDHPKIAISLKWLGDIYFECIQDYAEALRYYTESLAIYRSNYENQHADVIRLEQCIAKVHKEKGDLLSALEIYHRLLKLQEQYLPAGDLQISTLIDTIAKVYQEKGDVKDAMIFLQQKVVSQKKRLGEYHPSIASTLMTMGDISEPTEQQQYYEQALLVLNESSPRDETREVSCMKMLGILLLDDGEFEKGLSHLLHVLQIERRIKPSDSTDITDLLAGIGHVYFEYMNNYSEALSYCCESRTIYRSKYLPQHESVVEIEEKIEKVRQKLKK
ncbi:unnamed protein product [Adineta steineri]|uniref:NAD(P)(+)--arginine ADP-ribosyltransferase n=1 Tax=Adineta steineri TaxID=433720 RepID=A0A818VV87_9BILA|nr:unnamed protein product [Adineta steineri]CAF3716132.1 unnamed protein product [Adineta steineri]